MGEARLRLRGSTRRITGKGDKAYSVPSAEFDLPRDFVLQTLTLINRR